eukprot:m.3079 g.3079  ORF g.3079 m.3079 type:complete len:77 (+) comp1237_c0_seq1:534-764(+)
MTQIAKGVKLMDLQHDSSIKELTSCIEHVQSLQATAVTDLSPQLRRLLNFAIKFGRELVETLEHDAPSPPTAVIAP